MAYEAKKQAVTTDNQEEEDPVFYMLPGDSTKYSREELLAIMMPCKGGCTNQYVADPNSNALIDRVTSRWIYQRKHEVQAPPEIESSEPKVVTMQASLIARAIKSATTGVVHSDVKVHSER
ncbi:MAG: hypothetical protein V4606_01200 [Patescibacteria group bacterium]